MNELTTAQTIFWSLVAIGLIALAVWTALPDRKKTKPNDPNDCDRSSSEDKNCD